ncbi:MAG TPA: universal stress protein, partial [Nitrososphaeraceae archaeon]
MSLRRILVAVDGSDVSFNASKYAIDLAKTNGAELIALHVIYPTYSQYETVLSPRPERLQDVTRKEMEERQQYVDKVKQQATEKKVIVKTDIIVGITSIVKEIVEYAENNNVDIIVVGSRGMTGFKRILLGSVASDIVTYSHCP